MNFSPSGTTHRQNPEVSGKRVRAPLFEGAHAWGDHFLSFSSHAVPISTTLILGRPQVVGLKRWVEAQETRESVVTGNRVSG